MIPTEDDIYLVRIYANDLTEPYQFKRDDISFLIMKEARDSISAYKYTESRYVNVFLLHCARLLVSSVGAILPYDPR